MEPTRRLTCLACCCCPKSPRFARHTFPRRVENEKWPRMEAEHSLSGLATFPIARTAQGICHRGRADRDLAEEKHSLGVGGGVRVPFRPQSFVQDPRTRNP